MRIDGNIRLGDDPISWSREFVRRGIMMAVVANHMPGFKVWNFYRELARNTGMRKLFITL